MTKAIEYLTSELRGIRTGRASTALVEYVKVDYYGSPTDLNQLAAISTPEANQILIKPFDAGSVNAIKQGIENAGLGLNPQVEAKMIRITIPALDADRRKQLVSQAKKHGEEQKVVLRNARRDANKHAEQLGKDSDAHISEDEISTLKTRSRNCSRSTRPRSTRWSRRRATRSPRSEHRRRPTNDKRPREHPRAFSVHRVRGPRGPSGRPRSLDRQHAGGREQDGLGSQHARARPGVPEAREPALAQQLAEQAQAVRRDRGGDEAAQRLADHVLEGRGLGEVHDLVVVEREIRGEGVERVAERADLVGHVQADRVLAQEQPPLGGLAQVDAGAALAHAAR
jgi:ribosome recycling factor